MKTPGCPQEIPSFSREIDDLPIRLRTVNVLAHTRELSITATDLDDDRIRPLARFVPTPALFSRPQGPRMSTRAIRTAAARCFVLAMSLLAPIAAAQECGQRWVSEGSVPGVDGQIFDLEQMLDGDIIVAGQVTMAGRTPVGNIVRFDRQTGTWDPMGIGTDGRVEAVARLHAGRLLVGGSFSYANAQPASGLAIYSDAGWTALSSPINHVSTVEVAPDGQVWISGWNTLLRQEGTWRGDLTTWTRVSNTAYRALRFGSAGETYALIASTFSTPESFVEQWDGTTWSPVGSIRKSTTNPDFFFQATSLTLSETGDLVVAGQDVLQATRAAGEPRSSSACWTGEEWVALTVDSSFFTEFAVSNLWNNGIAIMVHSANTRRAVQYANGSLTTLPWQTNSGSILTLRDADGSLIVGGRGASLTNGSSSQLLRVSGTSVQPFFPGEPFDAPPVQLVRTPQNTVLARGGFTRVNGAPSSGYAMWDGSTWSPVPVNLSPFQNIFLSASGLVIGRNNAPFAAAVWNGQQEIPVTQGQPTVFAETQLQDGSWLFGGTLQFPTALFGLYSWDGTRMVGRFPGIRRATSLATHGQDLLVVGIRSNTTAVQTLLVRNGIISETTSSLNAAPGSFTGGTLLQRNGEVYLMWYNDGGTPDSPQDDATMFHRWNGQMWVPAFAPIPQIRVFVADLRADGTPVVLFSGFVTVSEGTQYSSSPVLIWDSLLQRWTEIPDAPRTDTGGGAGNLVALPDGGFMVSGAFTQIRREPAWAIARWLPGPRCCDSIDINNDGIFPDQRDIDDFMRFFAGGPCATPSPCESDFNNDGVFPDDRDIADFFAALAGGTCP